MKINLSTVLEAAGAVCLLAAAFAWDPRVALALLGLLLIVASFAVNDEPPA
jgi:uncharacterized membrane protein